VRGLLIRALVSNPVRVHPVRALHSQPYCKVKVLVALPTHDTNIDVARAADIYLRRGLIRLVMHVMDDSEVSI
jgi:hypothetical protein